MEFDVRCLVAAAVLFSLAGCSYEAITETTPATAASLQGHLKLSGKFLMTVDAPPWVLQRDIRPVTRACGVHNFPMDATTGFHDSVAQALEGALQSVQVVERSPAPAKLQSTGVTGHILVRAQELQGQVVCAVAGPGCEATVGLSVEVVVTGPGGKLASTTIQSTKPGRPSGWLCGSGATALKLASESATAEIAGRIIGVVSAIPDFKQAVAQ